MKSEYYTDNVPDMSGQGSFDSKGNHRDHVIIKISKAGQKERYMKMPHYAWSTPLNNRKKSYTYWKINLYEDDENLYVKAPSTFDRSRLVDKIDAFIEEEYGMRQPFDIVCQVSSREANANSEWMP